MLRLEQESWPVLRRRRWVFPIWRSWWRALPRHAGGRDRATDPMAERRVSVDDSARVYSAGAGDAVRADERQTTRHCDGPDSA
eukprot:4785103-Prymnesium_polylepis.1